MSIFAWESQMTADFAHLLIAQSAFCFALGVFLPAAWPRVFGRKGVTH